MRHRAEENQERYGLTGRYLEQRKGENEADGCQRHRTRQDRECWAQRGGT